MPCENQLLAENVTKYYKSTIIVIEGVSKFVCRSWLAVVNTAAVAKISMCSVGVSMVGVQGADGRQQGCTTSLLVVIAVNLR